MFIQNFFYLLELPKIYLQSSRCFGISEKNFQNGNYKPAKYGKNEIVKGQRKPIA